MSSVRSEHPLFLSAERCVASVVLWWVFTAWFGAIFVFGLAFDLLQADGENLAVWEKLPSIIYGWSDSRQPTEICAVLNLCP